MYRGAAPIYHTLLNRTPVAGVSIQTLHPTCFDCGDILLQTSPPFHIPPNTSYRDLHDGLAVHGASLLIETLRRHLFIPPIQPVQSPYFSSMAPKIVLGHSRVNWCKHTAADVDLRAGVLGDLWTKLKRAGYPMDFTRDPKVVLTDISLLSEFEPELDLEPGMFMHVRQGEEELMAVRCRKGWVRVGGVKMENRWLVHGGEWVRSLQGRGQGKRFK